MNKLNEENLIEEKDTSLDDTHASIDEPTVEEPVGDVEPKPEEDNVPVEDTPVEPEVPADNTVEPEAEPEPEVAPQPEPEATFTQSQVNEMIGKVRQEARERTMKELYERYGVNDDEELNSIFGNGQNYGILKGDFDGLNTKYSEAMTENALLKSQVIPSRWDDVKAILSAKGLDITAENIAAEMNTHPEWNRYDGSVEAQPKQIITPEIAENLSSQMKPEYKPSVISRLGGSIPKSPVEDDTEEERTLKMFNI